MHYTNTYIYICTHTHTHTYICIYVYTQIHIYMYICVYTKVHTYMYICVYKYTYSCNLQVLKRYATGTGWRRIIGSPKLQIIFHKRATKYRSLLRKMTYKDKGSYESSPPCIENTHILQLLLYTYNSISMS